ncbi:MAG: MFS transporter [Acetobacteraceae bacterium]|nr:MFS transporter [Acetobacteraceae bacterium]
MKNETDILFSQEEAVLSKVYRRLIVFLFFLFIASFLDRINTAYAALSMNKNLGLSGTQFGVANTVFYIGYLVCEVPSNFMMVRFGARRWIARIMITWGIAASATCLAMGPDSLYSLRFLVGVAEAGFLPGVLLYLTYWFPPSHRGRATAIFFLAQPITIILGGPLSGLIMRLDGLQGLMGWQWLFLLEGLPSIVLGMTALFYLTDSPAKAHWLTDAEKQLLAGRIAREEAVLVTTRGGHSKWASLTDRKVIMLCVAYFCLVVSLNSNSTWTPLIMQSVLGHGADYLRVGLMSAIPGVCAVIVMPLWSKWSDRHTQRLWFVVLPMALAAVGWLIVAVSHDPILQVIGLSMGSVGALTAMTVYWTLPALYMSPAARPAGTALVNAAGIMGSATAPTIIGALKDFTGSYSVGLWYTSFLLCFGISIVVYLLRSKHKVSQRVLKI